MRLCGSMRLMMKNQRWLLLLIILMGLALRLFRLEGQSLWYDEGITWLLSQMDSPATLIRWTAADIQPPLYYLLIWLTDILYGHSEWALRFPSALFGTLTIPLLARLARRLWPATSLTETLTALIVALSPLMVYYGQEARMYTLLVFAASLSSYFLLTALARPVDRLAPLWYALTAAAALYTHYFAAFLLLAHGVYALGSNWRQWRRLALMFGLTGLLFSPWLPTLLGRLGDDPSYWAGSLKLNEAIRKLLISFTAGETVLEATGFWLMLIFAALLLIGGGWVVITHNKPPTLLLWWLVLPPLLILGLSYRSPKFNPRYAMLAWPALTLLTAWLLSALFRAKRSVGRALAAVIALMMLGMFIFSLTNWFTDRRFAKDDFRAAAQFVRERAAPDETVLLSSGHLFPVWAYYFGWQNWSPLPDLPRLDVSRVTTLDIAAEMAPAVADKAGVWLVTWQDEVIDPNGVVPFWLDVIGERPNDAGDFWGIGLEHWRLKPAKLDRLTESPIEQELHLNFANQLELVGMTQLSDTDLALFWRARQPLPDNLILSLALIDSDGFAWDTDTLITPLGRDTYPPARWPVGDIVLTRHTLPWQTGTPPGLYVAELGLGQTTATGEYTGWDILDEQGRPQRRLARLSGVNLSMPVRPEAGLLPQDPDPAIDFLPIVAVRRIILPQTEAEPGDSLLLALLWQAGPYNLDDISVGFDLIDATGQTRRVGSSLTPSRRFNLPRWKPGETVLGQYRLRIPPDAASGPAQLDIHLIHRGANSYDEVFPLGELTILPATRNFTPPDSMDISLNADYAGLATLLGADCAAQCRAAPGDAIPLTLYWRAEASFDKNYTVFTHLLDAGDTVLVNADHAPPKPTQNWVPNEIITDPVTLTLPPDLPPGQYAIEVGLYDAADPNFARLPLTTGETRLVLPQAVRVQ